MRLAAPCPCAGEVLRLGVRKPGLLFVQEMEIRAVRRNAGIFDGHGARLTGRRVQGGRPIVELERVSLRAERRHQGELLRGVHCLSHDLDLGRVIRRQVVLMFVSELPEAQTNRKKKLKSSFMDCLSSEAWVHHWTSAAIGSIGEIVRTLYIPRS